MLHHNASPPGTLGGFGLRLELLDELADIDAKFRGSIVERHVAFLYLSDLLPEIIAALGERAPRD